METTLNSPDAVSGHIIANTIKEIINIYLDVGEHEELESFLEKHVEMRELQCLLLDREFLKMYLKHKLKVQAFQEVIQILKQETGDVSQDPELVSLWDEAHYSLYQNKHGRSTPLSSVQKFRIRKRNPPPTAQWQTCRPNIRTSTRSANILSDWLNTHWHNPYPGKKVKLQLAQQSGLTFQQVTNWFTNARRNRRHKILMETKPRCQVVPSIVDVSVQTSMPEQTNYMADMTMTFTPSAQESCHQLPLQESFSLPPPQESSPMVVYISEQDTEENQLTISANSTHGYNFTHCSAFTWKNETARQNENETIETDYMHSRTNSPTSWLKITDVTGRFKDNTESTTPSHSPCLVTIARDTIEHEQTVPNPPTDTQRLHEEQTPIVMLSTGLMNTNGINNYVKETTEMCPGLRSSTQQEPTNYYTVQAGKEGRGKYFSTIRDVYSVQQVMQHGQGVPSHPRNTVTAETPQQSAECVQYAQVGKFHNLPDNIDLNTLPVEGLQICHLEELRHQLDDFSEIQLSLSQPTTTAITTTADSLKEDNTVTMFLGNNWNCISEQMVNKLEPSRMGADNKAHCTDNPSRCKHFRIQQKNDSLASLNPTISYRDVRTGNYSRIKCEPVQKLTDNQGTNYMASHGTEQQSAEVLNEHPSYTFFANSAWTKIQHRTKKSAETSSSENNVKNVSARQNQKLKTGFLTNDFACPNENTQFVNSVQEKSESCVYALSLSNADNNNATKETSTDEVGKDCAKERAKKLSKILTKKKLQYKLRKNILLERLKKIDELPASASYSSVPNESLPQHSHGSSTSSLDQLNKFVQSIGTSYEGSGGYSKEQFTETSGHIDTQSLCSTEVLKASSKENLQTPASTDIYISSLSDNATNNAYKDAQCVRDDNPILFNVIEIIPTFVDSNNILRVGDNIVSRTDMSADLAVLGNCQNVFGMKLGAADNSNVTIAQNVDLDGRTKPRCREMSQARETGTWNDATEQESGVSQMEMNVGQDRKQWRQEIVLMHCESGNDMTIGNTRQELDMSSSIARNSERDTLIENISDDDNEEGMGYHESVGAGSGQMPAGDRGMRKDVPLSDSCIQGDGTQQMPPDQHDTTWQEELDFGVVSAALSLYQLSEGFMAKQGALCTSTKEVWLDTDHTHQLNHPGALEGTSALSQYLAFHQPEQLAMDLEVRQDIPRGNEEELFRDTQQVSRMEEGKDLAVEGLLSLSRSYPECSSSHLYE